MRKYNIINNSLGWLCFLIAAITYLLTIEPTASFWDCPEFITQGYKLEVGHPPGNPIFMLTARFFVTIFGGGAQTAAVAVNSMSALLSAGTILLLFWTITHLAKKLMVRDDSIAVSPVKTLLIMGAGICGALAYTWSDTFWFSAVEGEVYAFSSFCTALVFWLILKWENRADNPRSDRYLILIAYVIGISIAVHLLNLLCIPAIVLVIYYKKFKNTNVVGSLLALAISAVIIALILFGLVPGFVSVAQIFDLFFVNTLGMSYNMGVLVYAVITIAVFIWTIVMLRRQRSAAAIKFGVLFSVILSGMPFIGHGWFIPFVLISGLICYLFIFCKKVPVRIFNIAILSIFVIFIGYSSYALLLIRSTANTPMNQNAPDNVFTLGSYLNREQYGQTPLLFGPKMSEAIVYEEEQDPNTGRIYQYVLVDEKGNPQIKPSVISPYAYTSDGKVIDHGYDTYTQEIKHEADDPDRYVKKTHVVKPKVPGGMKTLFPRMYSDNGGHVSGYKSWSGYRPDFSLRVPQYIKDRWREDGYVMREELELYLNLDKTNTLKDYVAVGNRLSATDNTRVWQPSFWDNMKYFFNYQMNHMYWRYFMWNFAGRQNDIQGDGETHQGNWISGIPALDNARLGDQSKLPEEYTTGNAGHNVFYMLPLLLGILGIVWQTLMRHAGGEKRGVEQFWVVCFLFLMTGVAIVLYLNQPPGQPRERDYAFAGSFYAFAIWIGLGVPAIYYIITKILALINKKDKAKKPQENETPRKADTATWIIAGCATLIGLVVLLQMVSQTWDDHDRSGRYAARDFGMNYLNSLDDNAIIFVNGDNDTFPLWYAQEVEGVRRDVKVVNMSYLSQDWYARQVGSATYEAEGVPFYMPFASMDYGNTPYQILPAGTKGKDYGLNGDVTAEEMLTTMYKNGKTTVSEVLNYPPQPDEQKYYILGGPNIRSVYVPLDKDNILSKFGDLPADWSFTGDSLNFNGQLAEMSAWDITPDRNMRGGSPSQFANLMAYDIIARSAMEGFNRPVYFATTVSNNYYMGFTPNMFTTGMAQQITPFNSKADASPVAAKAYNNIIGKFRWGGVDSEKKVYLDETVRRMISSTRLAILQVADDLMETPYKAAPESAKAVSAEKGLPVPSTYVDMAQNLVSYMNEKLPVRQAPYENGIDYEVAQVYIGLAELTGNRADLETANGILQNFVSRVAKSIAYSTSLKGSMRSDFLSSERRNIYFALVSLSTMAYIDLELAAMDGKISPDAISEEVKELLTSANYLDYQSLIFMERVPHEAMAQDEALGNLITGIYNLFDTAGISPYVRFDNFAVQANVGSPANLLNLVY